MRAWMRYIEEVPTVAVRYPSFNMAFLSRFDGLARDRFHAEQADVRPLRKAFYPGTRLSELRALAPVYKSDPRGRDDSI